MPQQQEVQQRSEGRGEPVAGAGDAAQGQSPAEAPTEADLPPAETALPVSTQQPARPSEMAQQSPAEHPVTDSTALQDWAAGQPGATRRKEQTAAQPGSASADTQASGQVPQAVGQGPPDPEPAAQPSAWMPVAGAACEQDAEGLSALLHALRSQLQSPCGAASVPAFVPEPQVHIRNLIC